jgi:hypothetical protein
MVVEGMEVLRHQLLGLVVLALVDQDQCSPGDFGGGGESHH